jgi:TonB family protein
VLAPEDESRALAALRSSLASDIVELVVLSGDDTFLQTLREAVGAARRVWHVLSADKVSDLLLAGGVGILVLDVQALNDTASRFIADIKGQFPDLVVVVAGNRGAETELARLISEGTVYRFIHKPMSPARARLFADAAVKRYDEQRTRTGGVFSPPVAKTRNPGLLIGAVGAVGCMLLVGLWLAQHATREQRAPAPLENGAVSLEAAAPSSAEMPPGATTSSASARPASADDSALLSRASQALAANRLTAPPSGDNALELYLQALARDPGNSDAKAGLAEVHERLLARAENALLEDRMDEAGAAIETARKAGVESGRIAFLTAQLAKAREQIKATAVARNKNDSTPPAEGPGAQAERFAALALERIQDGHLIEPDGDNARFYVEAALKADPTSEAAHRAEQALALGLLSAARGAIDHRDFTRASSWLDAAAAVAAPANLDNLRQSLAAARRLADTDAANQLLKSAQQRLAEDRLIEPENDSAKYYVMTLRSVDPGNAGLAQMTSELGDRLVAKARGALTLQQYDAARSWLDQAASLGYTSSEAESALRELNATLARQDLMSNVVSANQLQVLKSVQPAYPKKAEKAAVEGWVELDFTVMEGGEVKDIAVHAANPPGVFDQAAISALAQWRYKPVLKDAQPAAQRARIRIRFALAR